MTLIMHLMPECYCYCSPFHRLGLVDCSDSELTSKTLNTFKYYGRTPLTGDRPIARPLYTQDSTTQKMRTHIHVSSGIRTDDASGRAVQEHAHLTPRGLWHQLIRE